MMHHGQSFVVCAVRHEKCACCVFCVFCSLCIDSVHPFESAEEQDAARKQLKEGRRGSSLCPTRETGARPCVCMDHTTIHTHKRCDVDLAVKSVAVGCALQVLAHERKPQGTMQSM